MPQSPAPLPAPSRRRSRLLLSHVWLILKNILGWILILLALVAGPLVPGPGGLPLFLIGFALISLPGKRHLTARVLRGRPYSFHHTAWLLVSLGLTLVLPAIVLLLFASRWAWLADAYARGPAWVGLVYLLGVTIAWLLVRLVPPGLNLLLRLIARARRRFRPWLRRHRIRLLPPRWRMRHRDETGTGPFRLKDEILKFTRRHPRP